MGLDMPNILKLLTSLDVPAYVLDWLSDYHNASLASIEAMGKVLIELRIGEPSKMDLDELEIAIREFSKYLPK